MVKKFDIPTLLNLLFVAYAFVLPLSRASAGIATALILLLFLLSPERKRWAAELWQSSASRWILFFVGFYFLSLLIIQPLDHTPQEWKEGIRNIFPYINILPAVVIGVALKKRFLPMILIALMLGMFVSEVISYGIFFEFWEKSRVLAGNPSPYMHHIQYSTFLAFVALVLFDWFARERRWGYRLLCLLFFIVIVGTLFLINGRTGQVAFLVGLFVLAFAHFQNKFKALLLSSLLAVLVISAAYELSDNFKERVAIAQSDIENMVEKGNFGTSLGYRVGVTLLSSSLIQERPLLGTGVIDTIPMIRKRAAIEFPNDYFLSIANHLQNQYLQVLVEIGIVGLAIFLMMLYKIARIPLRAKSYQNLKIIFLSVYLFTMLSDIQLHIQFTAGLFALIVGVLLAQSRIEGEENVDIAVQSGLQVKANG